MTSKFNEDEYEYDENCVFNRLLSETPKTSGASPAQRLERIFETTKAPDETINVADFLPIY